MVNRSVTADFTSRITTVITNKLQITYSNATKIDLLHMSENDIQKCTVVVGEII